MRGSAWRWTLWVYLALTVSLAVGIGVGEGAAFTDRRVTVDSSGELTRLGGSAKGAFAGLAPVAFAVLALISLSWVIRQLVRYRRSIGDDRQQLKWLMSGGAVCIIGFLASVAFNSARAEPWHAVAACGPFAIAALPLSIGVGILKYRLYEIDRLISRTISYALLTTMLAGVFLGIIVLMTDVLPLSSPVAFAASTLAAAALFNPLRRRTQRLIDRRFNRSRYDGDATAAAFTARLRDAIDLGSISSELLHVVDQRSRQRTLLSGSGRRHPDRPTRVDTATNGERSTRPGGIAQRRTRIARA